MAKFRFRFLSLELEVKVLDSKFRCQSLDSDFRATGLRFRVYYYLSLARENLIIPRRVKSHGCERVPRVTSAPSLRLNSSSFALMGAGVNPRSRSRGLTPFDFRV